MTALDTIKNIATFGAHSRMLALQTQLAAQADELKSLRDLAFAGTTITSGVGQVGVVRQTDGRMLTWKKQNPRTLRQFAENSWIVRAALDIYRDVIERAEWQLQPADGSKDMNESVAAEIRSLLTRRTGDDDSTLLRRGHAYSYLQGQLVEDALVLGHGVIEKKIRKDLTPYDLIPLDAAWLQFVPDWSGSIDDPRYVVANPASSQPLRSLADPMAMVLLSRPRSYDMLGLSHLEVLDVVVRAALFTDTTFLEEAENPNKGGVLNLGQGVPQPILDETRRQIDMVKRAFAVLGTEKAEWESFNLSEREARMLDKAEWFCKAAASVFQISAAKLQVTAEKMSRASTGAQFEAMDDGPAAMLWRLEELENQAIVGAFGDTSEHNIRLTYPIMSQRDAKRQADITQILSTADTLTTNQKLLDNGYDPIDLPIADDILITQSQGPPIPLSVLNRQYYDDSGKPILPEQTEPQAEPDPDLEDEQGGEQIQQDYRRRARKALPATREVAVKGAVAWWKKNGPEEARGLIQ